mmetsp:Transcript_46400/g.110524  ORF Transcript_46400/g.110524 Transcript_46400/m.110524 type:complete len:432 (+) Transcript_46400:128-1423(+)
MDNHGTCSGGGFEHHAGDPYPFMGDDASPAGGAMGHFLGFPSSQEPPAGDYYRFDDNVCRGVTLDESAFAAWSPDGYADTLKSSHDAWFIEPDALLVARQEPVARFCRDHLPAPELPQDPFFKLEPTSVVRSGGCPVEVGNVLRDGLLEEADIELEVNVWKFTLKVTAAWNGSECSVKIRIYGRPDGCTAEFQRRRGDAYAFSSLFRRCSCRLNGESVPQPLPLALEDPWAGELDLPPPPPGDELQLPSELDLPGQDSVQSLSPLLDMASSDCSPELQAEAAYGLDALSQQQSGCEAVKEQADDVLPKLRQLLQSERFAVAHPAACAYVRLLLSSAMHGCGARDAELEVALAMLESRTEYKGRHTVRRLVQAYRRVVGAKAGVEVAAFGAAQKLEALLQVFSSKDAEPQYPSQPAKSMLFPTKKNQFAAPA